MGFGPRPGQADAASSACAGRRDTELRKAFRSAGEADRLATQPPGYVLAVASAELDSLRFGELAAEGNCALAAAGAAAGAERLGLGPSLWREHALPRSCRRARV